MFAQKVAKTQTRAAPESSNSLARPRSTPTAQSLGPGEHTPSPQRNIGDQTKLRLTAQQTASKTNGRPSAGHEPERLPGRQTSPGASWDFTKTPVFPPGRASRSQSSFPSAAFHLPSTIQPKLIVGERDNPLEREADRVADQVMRAPMGTGSSATPQRKCAACEEADHSETLRARQNNVPTSLGTEAPALVNDVVRSAGETLDAPTRAFFEPRFGRDFSQVRVHADDRAARSAQSIGALAYAAGPHIAFAAGQYAPGSDRGRHLLAHELTHSIQQGHSCVRRSPGSHPEETLKYEQRAASPIEVMTGPAQEMVQRSAKWTGASVKETLSPAEIAFGGEKPNTWHFLNERKLATTADADDAIKIPDLTTSGAGTNWKAKIDTVPDQEGSAEETVIGPGPWTKTVTKISAAEVLKSAAAGNVTNIAACAGAGNSTFTVHGKPTDDEFYKANRRHEDHHVADHKVAFEDAIGKWDKKLQDAKNKRTEFKGSSEAKAAQALWTAMGNTPQGAARLYRTQGLAKGTAYHTTPGGKEMRFINPVASSDCSTSSLDDTNPA